MWKSRDIFSSAGAVRAPALDGATTWLNSDPLTAKDISGQVVAYDFWTYTCVNWLRTLPYRRAWADHYHDHGLIVIGIHTPEFAFERELTNVRKAVALDRIDYPVAIDNDYAIWRAWVVTGCRSACLNPFEAVALATSRHRLRPLRMGLAPV
jgi:hypothetical protein